MANRNTKKVQAMMRIKGLQTVYQMLLWERSVLDVAYIEAEIKKAEQELDQLNESGEE